jgi:hypothetical protein
MKTRRVLTSAKDMGVEVNVSKYMTWNDQPYQPNRFLIIRTDVNKEYKFDEVETFTYLGTTITRKPEMCAEIKARITSGTKSAAALKSVLSSKIFSRSMKVRVYKTIIRPAVTYGSEVWTLRKQDQLMLRVWERKILRKIYGGKCEEGQWLRRTNQELNALYGEENIVGVVKAQRLRWLGHLVRMGEQRTPNKIYRTKVGGKRRRGRPKSQWKKEVYEDLNSLNVGRWEEKARNRKEWTKITKEAMGLLGL